MLLHCDKWLIDDFFFSVLLGRLHLSICVSGTSNKPSQAQIVDDIFNALHIVLDSVSPLSQNVIFEIQQLKARKQVLEKRANGERQLKVAKRNGVGGQATELLGQVGEGEQVLFNGEVEGVAVLEVGGHGKDGADLLEGEEVADLS